MLRINVIVSYLMLTAFCWQFEMANSRTSSTLWKLSKDSGKILSGESNNAGNGDKYGYLTLRESLKFDASADVYTHDEVFYIIASTLNADGNGWVRLSPENSLEFLMAMKIGNSNITKSETIKNTKKMTPRFETTLLSEETLDCGKPVNFTYYDYLIGVGQRFNYPNVPEPEVAYLFLKTKDENSYKNFDIAALERRLKKAKREKIRTVQLYNQIGNYWRIIGNARQAIECFRRALAMSPTNAEVLLNLARVLYNLQYLDDAIHLTRRSLEMQPPGRSAWQQYFTLGEIFKAYGHFQESVLHLRHALELYPQHEPILKALRDLEKIPSSTLHGYTVVIIVALVVAVFIVIISSTSSDKCSPGSIGISSSICLMGTSDHDSKSQRHFNRAMAMRSLKGLSASRNHKHKRNN